MAEWIAETFNAFGYWGIALAMLLENVFPPIPSEAVLPGAGIAARRGELSLVGVIVAAAVGSLVGAILWYEVGRRIGSERLRGWADRRGRYLGISPDDVARADAWFDRWGGPAVLFGRMIPGVRTLISVPAGISGMPFGRFVAYSAVGTTVWTTLLVMVGWWLGRSAEIVEQAVGWTTIAVVVGFAAWFVYRVWKSRRGSQDRRPASRQTAGRRSYSGRQAAVTSWSNPDEVRGGSR